MTAITAWELLFERLQIAEGEQDLGQSLLIVGAAGGVGSILTQLASKLTGLTVIGSASRPQTQDWVRELGADQVVDHRQPLAAALKAQGIDQVTHVASLTQTDQHLDQLVEALAPQGKLALIDDPSSWTSPSSSARACRCTGSSCTHARCSKPPTSSSSTNC